MGLPRRKRPVSWSPSGLETVAFAPNLSFELVRVDRARAELRAYFELESRPPWAPSDWAGLRDVWLTLTPSRVGSAGGCGGGCCG